MLYQLTGSPIQQMAFYEIPKDYKPKRTIDYLQHINYKSHVVSRSLTNRPKLQQHQEQSPVQVANGPIRGGQVPVIKYKVSNESIGRDGSKMHSKIRARILEEMKDKFIKRYGREASPVIERMVAQIQNKQQLLV